MKHGRFGLLAGGNWILDHTKIIDRYPEQDALANILDHSIGNGGSAYNILKDLSKLNVDFPLQGVGLIGDDSDGRFILEDCRDHNIDFSGLKVVSDVPTSNTYVMTEKPTGRRTFFHQRGANALLSRGHFNLKESAAKIFHLGYLLLLDKLDKLDDSGRSEASYLLEEAVKQGFKTSIDIVSENSNRFHNIIHSSLAYTDYLFVNEYEASKISNVPLVSQVNPDISKYKVAAEVLMKMGVRKWVFIHCPQLCLALNSMGEFFIQGSLQVPNDQIIGSSGAGDAFAAGVLYGLHEEKDIQECLKWGVATAAASINKPGCSEGVLPLDAIAKLENYWPAREFAI